MVGQASEGWAGGLDSRTKPSRAGSAVRPGFGIGEAGGIDQSLAISAEPSPLRPAVASVSPTLRSVRDKTVGSSVFPLLRPVSGLTTGLPTRPGGRDWARQQGPRAGPGPEHRARRWGRMSDQNLAARARAALDAGEGILRLAPTWVPRSFLMPGGRLKLARAGPLRPGHPPRRHRRALVRLDHAGRQRRAPRRRGAQLRRPRRRPVHPQGRDRRCTAPR